MKRGGVTVNAWLAPKLVRHDHRGGGRKLRRSAPHAGSGAQGHAEISVGNILGTIVFFVLFNVGLIAMIQPLAIEPSILRFYWPAMMLALGLVIIFLWRGRVARPEGAVLLVLYLLYAGSAIAWDVWP